MYRVLFPGRTQPREPFVSREPLVFIGRDATCHLNSVEAGVSDRHAAIERREDGYYIRDLDSANGVRVNGQPVKQQRLASGDELELGSLRLKFEIVHAPPRQRPPGDPLQWAAAVVVAVIIVGQVWILGRIFSQPRPKQIRTQTIAAPTPAQPGPSPTEKPDVPASVPATSPSPVSPNMPATAPVVLDRMIRIVRVDRADASDSVTLTIHARAQVGERELDSSAAVIGVQFFSLDATGRAQPTTVPLWLSLPRWENFTTRSLTAKFSGAPQQLAGYVVRSYYRGKLQDVVAVPSTLLAPAAEPMP